MKIGIDAVNIRSGGGVTHLLELLSCIDSLGGFFDSVVVWGTESTLHVLSDRPWLIKRHPAMLERGFLARTLWQFFYLSKAARREQCSVLLVPGGSYVGTFQPVIVMSQNLLPFEFFELKRYGWSLFTIKLLILRQIQSLSFKRADGVIFLSEYARNKIMSVTGKFQGVTRVIPHGVNPRFFKPPKSQRECNVRSNSCPLRLLYVSTVDLYKHQWNVVEAVSLLRNRGTLVELDLIGSANLKALKKLELKIASIPSAKDWVNYYGEVSFERLHDFYAAADLGIFASSCENMPNILLEMMASGLPIACSNKGPMMDILGDAGEYFNPESASEIEDALLKLLKEPKLREKMAMESFKKSRLYSWDNCALDTLLFMSAFIKKDEKNVCK